MLIMLSADLIFKDTLFIKYKESGYIGHLPHVNYCLVEYDKNFYDDDLLARFGQPFPDVLRNASIKRKAEYLAGRYCGQSLLREKRHRQLLVLTREYLSGQMTGAVAFLILRNTRL